MMRRLPWPIFLHVPDKTTLLRILPHVQIHEFSQSLVSSLFPSPHSPSSAKIMRTWFNQWRGFVSRNGPSSIRKKQTTSLDSFSSKENDYVEQSTPPYGFKNKSGKDSRRSKVDLGSTPIKSLQSQNLTIAKAGLSLKRKHKNPGGKNRDQTLKRKQDLPFDICSPVFKRNVTSIQDCMLEEESNGVPVQQVSNKHRVLRPGMVLLKDFLTHDAQVDIVKTCRELGVEPKGFYQPGYSAGSKLNLQMMCFGRNWDPQTKYGTSTELDSKAPDIPEKFSVLVEEAIREAHALIDRESGTDDAERILPVMSPDICIVNFYLETGRLGLHQDRDESRESIVKGLPIVSFSIGDSAEFLYGDKRDVKEAEKVILESGDVLIFGGESRMIFHGVKSIIPNSAPMSLLHESKLRTGRLNLTFRHF
ncbi:Alpha-ketoglutarate-dependent dioxygenase alkB [Cardamine amara subsp. amara]|uniref:DNA N(6)-methyladenine demethylase n=1 Tax=Cardamine amara subsp. amara TaxID=228776 RepID=A0ABD1BFE4_CARAN